MSASIAWASTAKRDQLLVMDARRARALSIFARSIPEPRTPLDAARAVLAWVLGEADWPQLEGDSHDVIEQ